MNSKGNMLSACSLTVKQYDRKPQKPTAKFIDIL